ncbi:MAG TPA: hypothetical protein VIT43_15710 [Candidatus Dormibacteraeota bacterium]
MRTVLRFLTLSLTAVLLAACGTASAASNLKVYAGYADNLQTVGARSNPSSFPNPWQGGSSVNFKGSGDKYDSGAIRIQNTTGADLTVDKVTVDIGSKHYDLWGSNLKVPANGSLILAQTSMGTKTPPEPNFDTSEPNGAAAGGGGASSAVPVIHVTVNGTTTDYHDDGKILNTGGTDKGDLAGAPNESHQWQEIAAINAAASKGSGLSPLLLFAPLAAMLLALFSFIPKLIGALLLLLIGWWIAKALAGLVVRLLERLGFGTAVMRTGMFGWLGSSDGATAAGGATAAARPSRPVWLIGEIVKWFVFLIFVELAVEALGLAQVADLLHRVILWLPNLVVALLVLFLGALLAQFVGRLVRGTATSGNVGNAGFLGRLVEYGIIALAAVVALNQLGIATVFVDILFAGVVGALALAAGLAFGLGGRNVASRMWRQTYDSTQATVTSTAPRALPEERTTPTTVTTKRNR